MSEKIKLIICLIVWIILAAIFVLTLKGPISNTEPEFIDCSKVDCKVIEQEQIKL